MPKPLKPVPVSKPKTLSEVCPSPNDAVFTSRAIEQNPLAVLIAVAANSWTALELELGETLAFLLHAQPEVGLSIYSAITSAGMKQTILEVAAGAVEPKLDKTELDVLAELLKELSYLYSERIKCEHRLWGHSSSVPNALLRISPKHVLEHHLLENKYSEDRTSVPTVPSPIFPLELIEVFYRENFDELIKRMDDLAVLFFSFRHWLAKTQIQDRWQYRLRSLPQIAAILAPTHPTPQTLFAGPRQPPRVPRPKKP